MNGRRIVFVSAVFEHDAPVDVDVLVLAARALGDLELDVDELLQVGRKLGELVQVQPAGVQVRLEPLDVLAGGHDVVAPQEPAPELRGEDSQRPLEHGVSRGLCPGQFHPLDVHLVLAVRDGLELAFLDLGMREIVVELCEVDVLGAAGLVEMSVVFVVTSQIV